MKRLGQYTLFIGSIFAAAFAASLYNAPIVAQIQNPGVTVSGSVVAGNAVKFLNQFQIQDAGVPFPTSFLTSVTCGAPLTCTPNPIVSTGTITMPNTIVGAGPIGNSTTIPVITFDNQGRLTAVTTASISGAVASVFGRSGAVVAQPDDYAAFNGLAPAGNCTVVPSVAANNVTFAIKQADGATDPTASAPCVVNFPSGTLTSSATVLRKVTAASAVTLNSGSTLGVANGVSMNVWAVFIDTGATAVLGVGTRSNATQIFALDETGVITSTACAACATATATGTIYSTAAQTNAPYRIAGYSQFTLATAGVWASGPVKVRNYASGMPRPGQPTGNAVQPALVITQTTNTTTAYVDTLCTMTITPSSAANYVWVTWNGQTVVATGGDAGKFALRRGGTVVGGEQTAGGFTGAANAFLPVSGGGWMDNPQTAGAVTYTVAEKMLLGTGGVTFPHAQGGCTVSATEIMG